MSEVKYGYTRTIENISYEQALEKITAALKEEGFGILTEIDVQATLKKKIDADFRKYKILGACNPKLAHKALSTELPIGLMLPCNAVVYEEDDGRVTVSVAAPKEMFKMIDNKELQQVADDADARVRRALENI